MQSVKRQDDGINYTHHYKKWHSDTEKHQNDMMRLYRQMLTPYLPKDKTIRILDIGCGMGFLLQTLNNLGYERISGMEASKEQAEICQEKGLDVMYSEDTVEELQKRPEMYDLILCIDVLEHIPVSQQLSFIQAIHASLRSHGKFICTVPNANSVLASRWRYIDWTHHASFTEHSLDFLLYNAGFSDILILPAEPYIRKKVPFQTVLSRLVRWMRRVEMVAELGEEGKHIPLSINLMAVSYKS